MNKKTTIVYSGIILATCFWGLSYVWFKMLNEYYRPLTIIFLRLTLSSIFLLVFAKMVNRLQKIDKKDRKFVLLLAFFSPFLYFIGESFGLTFVHSTTAAVIVSTIPVFIPFAAHYFLREKLSLLNYLGLSISFFGVLIIIINKDYHLEASLAGILILLLAVFSGVAYSILLKKMTSNYNAISLITYQNIAGIVYFLPLFLFFDFNRFIQVPLTADVVIPVIELAIFASSFAFIFFAIGIRELGATKASIFSNLVPIFTAIFAFLLLNESLTLRKIIGIIIVITGVFLSQYRSKFLKQTLDRSVRQ
ncbi:hypothetical protein ES708_00745 [subsurface metagenome]